MKTRLITSVLQSSCLSLAAAIIFSFSAQAASGDTFQSVFIQPISPKEGCDPFFPHSNRPYEAAMASSGHTPELTSLVIKGFSGPPNNRFVIINNHTFAAGDYGEVATPEGRLYIHCLEIRGDTVIVESRGQRQTLTFSSTP